MFKLLPGPVTYVNLPVHHWYKQGSNHFIVIICLKLFSTGCFGQQTLPLTFDILLSFKYASMCTFLLLQYNCYLYFYMYVPINRSVVLYIWLPSMLFYNLYPVICLFASIKSLQFSLEINLKTKVCGLRLTFGILNTEVTHNNVC